MNFNKHFHLSGKHAFLSASKYHWLNYDEEKLEAVFRRSIAAQRGTRLHELAAELIRLQVKLPRTSKTLDRFVNDALGFKMEPEVLLYYSDNAFGTADAISFRKNTLRIHDLKTGNTRASFNQLMIYAGLFCLEYNVKPGEINIELRIYQTNEVLVLNPEPVEVVQVISKIISADKLIEQIKTEEDDL